MRTLAAALIAALPLPALAGDASTYDVVGFSPDGKYVAVIEHGVLDGSGFPWATLQIVDVARNAWAGKPEEVVLEDEEATEDQALARAREGAAAARKRLKVARWEKAVPLPLDDKWVDPSDVWGLKLDERPAKGVKAENCGPLLGEPKLMTLRLVFFGGDPERVLQRDAKLPKSRGCATSYEVHKAWGLDRSLLVMVRYERPGFEGNDSRYLAITGRMDFGVVPRPGN